jgi:hypothetical protein
MQSGKAWSSGVQSDWEAATRQAQSRSTWARRPANRHEIRLFFWASARRRATTFLMTGKAAK